MTPLEPDSACCRQANWRTDLPPGLDVAGVERRMEDAGWTSRSRHPALKVFRHGEGHEVAWVVTTGRVQIRIDFEVPRRQRRRRAQTLYRELGACLTTTAERPEAYDETGEGSVRNLD